MAGQESTAKPQAPQQDAPGPAPASLGAAGASSDPLVHQLLAERAAAVLNGDADGVNAADEALAELGVSAE